MMRRLGWARGLVVLAAGAACGVSGAQTVPATLKIDVGKTVAKVSPTLYGLMTEEINYSYEGGLYAELVQNRNFASTWAGVGDWFLSPFGTAQGSMAQDRTTGPSTALASSLKITVQKADAANALGVWNDGWWGVPVRSNTTYTGSVWAKADAAGTAGAGLQVSLVAETPARCWLAPRCRR